MSINIKAVSVQLSKAKRVKLNGRYRYTDLNPIDILKFHHLKELIYNKFSKDYAELIINNLKILKNTLIGLNKRQEGKISKVDEITHKHLKCLTFYPELYNMFVEEKQINNKKVIELINKKELSKRQKRLIKAIDKLIKTEVKRKNKIFYNPTVPLWQISRAKVYYDSKGKKGKLKREALEIVSLYFNKLQRTKDKTHISKKFYLEDSKDYLDLFFKTDENEKARENAIKDFLCNRISRLMKQRFKCIGFVDESHKHKLIDSYICFINSYIF
jgi:hypothetical protein